MTKKHNFKIGDKIAYSVQFLKSICMSHSEMARGRGEIVGFKDYGIILAEIKWNVAADDCAGLVNICNLAKVGLNTKFSNC